MTGAGSTEQIDDEDVIKVFRQLGTLTYQQKQMLREGDYQGVFGQLLRSGRAFDLLSIAGTLSFGTFAFWAVTQRMWPVVSSIGFLVCLAAFRSRRAKIREIAAYVERLESITDRPPVPALISELRSRHMLTYAQLQQLKAGEPIKAAQTALVVATGQVSSAFAEMAGMLRMISISYQEPIEAQAGRCS